MEDDIMCSEDTIYIRIQRFLGRSMGRLDAIDYLSTRVGNFVRVV